MIYDVQPNFNATQNQLAFSSSELNYLLMEEIVDTIGFYQQQFGVYSYMTLNSDRKFITHKMGGNPMLWQKHASCAWTPKGDVRIGQDELEPCKAKINAEWCYDELFDSCFKHFMSWDGSAPLELNAEGVNMVNMLVNTIAQNAALGARLTLTAGQLFDPGSVDIQDGVSQSIQDLFASTIGTCRGWVELFKELATQDLQKYGHLNRSDLLSPDLFSADGKKFTGDILELYDALMDDAPANLQGLVNEGGIVGVQTTESEFMALMLVSNSFHAAVARQWREQCDQGVLCPNPRLSRERFTVAGARNPKSVYYIDDTPVVPVSEISYYDRYLTGTMHFVGIIANGNIGLGTSFGSINDVMAREMGLLVEASSRVEDYGMYKFLAHALMANHLADPSFAVAAQTYLTPSS